MDHHELFNQKSELYATARPQYPAELFNYLAAICDENKTAWDGACGNGQAAVDISSYFDEVHATDVSVGQIANAIPNPRVTYSVQPSEATNFSENQFDLVCIAQALHWFDYDLFWPEVKRVLKPGGVFAAWGYSWFSIEEKIDECIQEKFLKFLEPYWAEQNKLLWDGYQNIPFPFVRIEPPLITMKVVWDFNQLFGYLKSWSAARRCIDNIGEAFFMDAYDETKTEWGNVNIEKIVEMDFCLIVGQNDSLFCV